MRRQLVLSIALAVAWGTCTVAADSTNTTSSTTYMTAPVSLSAIVGIITGASAFMVGVVAAISGYFRDQQQQKTMFDMQKQFATAVKELEDKQRRLIRFENIEELMKQYKKPLLLCAFDLQSRVANQIKQNFVQVFVNGRGNERDRKYAYYNFAFVIAEFLGWLEIIRREIVFITGEDSHNLSSLVDAIKFQFTGETPVQGLSPNGDVNHSYYDKNATVLQLYAGELRGIGEVMLEDMKKTTDPFAPSTLVVIGYAEFVRRMTKKAGGEIYWEHSLEKNMQDTLRPLMQHVDALSTMTKEDAPTRRLTILQVLLCRLIDALDDAVPWDNGAKWDLHKGEEPQYIMRDFRVMPLVKHLTSKQCEWLAQQPFMADADAHVEDEGWHIMMEENPEEHQYWRKLCFAGFRDDLKAFPQFEREQRMGKDSWMGACPPKVPRNRPAEWYESLDPEEREQYPHHYDHGRLVLGLAPTKEEKAEKEKEAKEIRDGLRQRTQPSVVRSGASILPMMSSHSAYMPVMLQMKGGSGSTFDKQHTSSIGVPVPLLPLSPTACTVPPLLSFSESLKLSSKGMGDSVLSVSGVQMQPPPSTPPLISSNSGQRTSNSGGGMRTSNSGGWTTISGGRTSNNGIRPLSAGGNNGGSLLGGSLRTSATGAGASVPSVQ